MTHFTAPLATPATAMIESVLIARLVNNRATEMVGSTLELEELQFLGPVSIQQDMLEKCLGIQALDKIEQGEKLPLTVLGFHGNLEYRLQGDKNGGFTKTGFVFNLGRPTTHVVGSVKEAFDELANQK